MLFNTKCDRAFLNMHRARSKKNPPKQHTVTREKQKLFSPMKIFAHEQEESFGPSWHLL